jgi:hypothetical protein
MAMQIKFWQQLWNEKRTKNLTPWRDSNPGSTVLEAEAMTTMPRRQGKSSHLVCSSSCCVFRVRKKRGLKRRSCNCQKLFWVICKCSSSHKMNVLWYLLLQRQWQLWHSYIHSLSNWLARWNSFWKTEFAIPQQGCQIFICATYQNGENIPINHKIYQITVK